MSSARQRSFGTSPGRCRRPRRHARRRWRGRLRRGGGTGAPRRSPRPGPGAVAGRWSAAGRGWPGRTRTGPVEAAGAPTRSRCEAFASGRAPTAATRPRNRIRAGRRRGRPRRRSDRALPSAPRCSAPSWKGPLVLRSREWRAGPCAFGLQDGHTVVGNVSPRQAARVTDATGRLDGDRDERRPDPLRVQNGWRPTPRGRRA